MPSDTPQPDDVLRRMLATPPQPKVSPPKGDKSEKAKKRTPAKAR